MVYVDPPVTCRPTVVWPYTSVSHLTADAPDELHAFAKRLRLKREWYQDSHKNPTLHHYDITSTMRVLAVSLGAKELSRQEVAERLFEK